MTLSDEIKIMRQKALLSQEEFAKRLDVSLASVNRWEVGKSIPNLTAMKAIKDFCSTYGLPYESIESSWIQARMENKE